MAKYGTRKYSTFLYGQVDSVGIYYNSKIVAKSYDYKATYVVWENMSYDPNDPAPTHWKLVKSFTGTPDDPFDAIKVDGGTMDEFKNYIYESFVDNLDSQINYSLWLFNGLRWVFCGSSETLVIDETNTLDKIGKWIPRAWLNEENAIGDITGELESSNVLVQTLGAFAFIYDQIAVEGDILEKTSSYKGINNSLVTSKILDLGFNYEPVLGENYYRSLYNAGNEINVDKGTTTGIETFATALTHWDSKVEIGHNRILDYNDSSFEDTIGKWGVTGTATLASQKFSTSLADLGVLVSINETVLADTLYPPRANGFGLLTTHTNSTVTLHLPSTDKTPTLYGIPVEANTYYVFSGWIQQLGASTADVNVKINWYDYRNHHLGSTDTVADLTTDGSWQEFTSYSWTGREGAKSPNTAAFATLSVNVTCSNSGYRKFALDLFQLSKAEDSMEFEDARRVRVYVKGEQENYILNPDFEQGIGFWTASPNGSIAQDPTIYPGALEHGNCINELTILSGTGGYISSDWVSVDPGQNYTFSGFVSCAYTADFRTAVARIEFSNRATIERQTETITDANGQYFYDEAYYADSDPYTLNYYYVADETSTTHIDPTLWPAPWTGSEPLYFDFFEGVPQGLPEKTKFEVTAITPPQSRDSGSPLAKLTIYFPDAEPGDTFWIDGMMLQETAEGKDYFGGNGANAPDNPVDHIYFSPSDCIWEIKNRFNYANNSGFETTDDWVDIQGALSIVSSGVTPERIVNPNGSLGPLYPSAIPFVPELFPYGPLFGSGMGQVTFGTYGVPNPGGEGEISTTVYLPRPAKGGEDFVISVWVRGGEGTYTLYTNKGQSDETSRNLTVIQHDQYQWIRAYCVRNLTQGETQFEVNLKLVNALPSFGIPQSNYFQLDGFQAEYGRIPTAFIDPNNSLTKSMPNPGNTAKIVHMTQEQSVGGGKSSYFYNYFNKLSRLYANLESMMPYGVSYCVKPGYLTLEYQGELSASIIPSASFERDLGEWLGVDSILNRIESLGTLSNDTTVQGTSYCRVKSTHASSSGDNTWSIKTSKLPIKEEAGYYSSVAIRPSADSYGTYTLDVTFYGPDDSIIQNYIESTTLLATVDPGLKDPSVRWNYLADVFSATAIQGASYAILKVTCDPTSFTAGQYFDIDRCVFRE
jgi:hypothetical protein